MVNKMDDPLIYQATLDAAIDAIVVVDHKGIITHTNSATSSLFGYNRSELIGQNVALLMPEDIARHHDGYLQHHIETGEKKIIGIGRDIEAKRSDGSLFPAHLSIGRAETNGALFFVGILHDLTRRRKAEATAARSQRMDAIGQLTGGVAHDFNNLLTVVIGNLELLEPKLNDPEDQELLNDALEAAELGADLTARLLGLARREVPQSMSIDINEAANSLKTLLHRTLGPKIDFSLDLAPDLWKTIADPSGLQTALLNLVLNAKDAMPDGGSLVIETKNTTLKDNYIVMETGIEPGDYVQMSVSDTGQGMDAATKARAFEPFFTTKPKGKGTGFGLSMVYAFMKQSNGHTTFYSEIGQGTTFSLYFPRSDTDISPQQSEQVSDKQYGHGEQLLVVEDDEKVRKLSVARLDALGYKVISAPDADEALKILRSNANISLVFSDVVMPGDLSGFALARQINEEFPGVKILLTSGFSNTQLEENGNNRHSYPMLRKPFRQVELAQMLQALLTEG